MLHWTFRGTESFLFRVESLSDICMNEMLDRATTCSLDFVVLLFDSSGDDTVWGLGMNLFFLLPSAWKKVDPQT